MKNSPTSNAEWLHSISPRQIYWKNSSADQVQAVKKSTKLQAAYSSNTCPPAFASNAKWTARANSTASSHGANFANNSNQSATANPPPKLKPSKKCAARNAADPDAQNNVLSRIKGCYQPKRTSAVHPQTSEHLKHHSANFEPAI